MKRFKFGLQSVRREREIREGERQRDLGIALKEQQGVMHAMEELESSLRKCLEETLEKRLAYDLEPEVIKNYEDYGRQLTVELQGLILQLNKCQEKVLECRQILAVATKRKKVLTRLKERQESAYYLEADQLEQKVTDAMTVMRAGGQHG